MRLPWIAAALVSLALAISASAEPKAYDLVRYHGHVAGLSIALDFADGYPQASELKITEGEKRTRFVLDDSGAMRFVPEKGAPADGEVRLKLGLDDAAPRKLEGVYRRADKAVPFTLTQR